MSHNETSIQVLRRLCICLKTNLHCLHGENVDCMSTVPVFSLHTFLFCNFFLLSIIYYQTLLFCLGVNVLLMLRSTEEAPDLGGTERKALKSCLKMSSLVSFVQHVSQLRL